MNKILKLRKQIDAIDGSLLSLLHRRIRVARQIKHIKASSSTSVFSPEREVEILQNMVRRNKSLYPEESLLKIYSEIFSASRKIQRPLNIGYLGPGGTFSEQAALSLFGSQSRYHPLDSIKSVFSELENGQIDLGVVPIENSTDGIVGYTLDMLIEYGHFIAQEFYLQISQNIISREKGLNRIKTLYTIPQALAQCRVFIENNLKRVRIMETLSTAQAAKICLNRKNAAAIASRNAAEKYGLNVLAEKINDNINNYTRFFVISREPNRIAEKLPYKTSLVVGLKDKPGALYSIIRPFNKYRINMTKIESRPTKKKAWEYIFFIELLGSLKDSRIKKAVHEVEEISTYLKILGSYPVNRFIL